MYADIEDQLQDFTDEEAGQIFKALLAYANRGVEMQTKDRAVRCLFKNIKATIDRTDEAYEQKCETNRRIAEERERRRREARAAKEETEVHDRTQTYTDVHDEKAGHLINSSQHNSSQHNSSQHNDNNKIDVVVVGDGKRKGLDKEIEQMKGAQVWAEQMRMRYKLTQEQLTQWLDTFALDCQCRGTTGHDSLQNAQRHFNDWLRIQLTKNSNGNGNGNTGNRTDARQRLTEYAAVAAEFREESYNDLAGRGDPPK